MPWQSPFQQAALKGWKKKPNHREFNLIIQGISDEESISHLFTVDIEFDRENSVEKTLLFNEIYTHFFEKKNVLSPNKWSVFQLLVAMRLNDKGTLNLYKTTAKTHSTMDKKFLIPLYVEHLYFLLIKCCWCISKIYAYYTFEQSKFKRDVLVMSQVLRKNAKTSVEKDFNKLMNNSNFAYDCRNNVDNCSFTPILDEIEELSYAKRYQNIFDQNIDLLEKQIEEEFTNRTAALDQQSEYYKARKNSLVIKKKEFDAVFSMKRSWQKTKNCVKDIE